MTFLEATRQNIVPLPAGAQAFTSGQPVSSTLPRAGYGCRVIIHVNGTMTVTLGGGTAALSATGPFSLFSRLGVLVNAATDILSLSEYGLTTNWPNTPVPVTGAATAAFVGNAFVDVEFFEVPARPEDRPDIRFLHTLTESRMALTSAGDNFVPLPRGNTYLRVLHSIVANGALDTVDLNKLELSWNQTTKPYNIRRHTQLMLQRARYGQDMPVGAFVHDWFTTRTTRDVIHTHAITDLMSNVSLLSGTTLGSNNNFVDTIAEQLVQIAA